MRTREKLALEAAKQIDELEQTRTESFQLNYQKAEDVQKLLSDPNQRILSKRGSAVVDTRTNTLFVQDVPSRLDEVRKLITKIDIPVRQVHDRGADRRGERHIQQEPRRATGLPRQSGERRAQVPGQR